MAKKITELPLLTVADGLDIIPIVDDPFGSAITKRIPVDDLFFGLVTTTGSWTPSIGGTATYTLQYGQYTKIGRVVLIDCLLAINVLGTRSTNEISGLPFLSIQDFGISLGLYSALATSVVSLYGRFNAAGTTISLFGSTIAAVNNTGTGTIFGNGTSVTISGFYFTT